MRKEEREALVKAVEDNLDTRDKRFMFLKCSFKKTLPYINLEGNIATTSFNIVEEFEKRSMCGSLMACMNNVFDLDLTLTIE